MKKILLFFLFVLCVGVLCACASTPPPKTDGTLRVMVTENDGIIIEGNNPINVSSGEDAVFNVRIKDGYSFDSVNVGEYDKDSGTLTVKSVSSRTRIKFNVSYVGYSGTNTFYYDFEGAMIDLTSDNLQPNEYYQTQVEQGKLKITLLDKYYNYAECASLFWDDGTFTKEGYILKEYNTKKDGTGEGYSLGSKFYAVDKGEIPTLYCIWQKAEDEELFTYEDYVMPKPESAKYAPDWTVGGVIITSYLGDATELTVPEYIDGKKVIAIKSGAFTSKNFDTLILPKTLQRVEDGSFRNCNNLKTLYFPNSIYEMYDDAFDAATYDGFTTLVVNATMAPRYSHSTDGAFAVKFSRFLASQDKKQIVVISGSSSYQGLATEYMEALFDGEYTVINFGTTRPRPGLIYLEALSHYTDADDIFVYAPENSSFMMGEGELNFRILRDLEGMNNIFRYVDISNYYGYFSSFTELNQEYQYTSQERKYEDICNNGWNTSGGRVYTDKNGDYQHPKRVSRLDNIGYVDAYYLTFNERFKSKYEGTWNDVDFQYENRDYTDLSNPTWISIDDDEMVSRMNMAINKARASGAAVYFGFAPSDADALVDEARSSEWLDAYDALILELYNFDGILGSCKDYIYNTKYAYDCAFHVNDYGRVYRTYQLYRDISEKLGRTEINGIYSKGRDFDGCLFEDGSDGTPVTKADYLH